MCSSYINHVIPAGTITREAKGEVPCDGLLTKAHVIEYLQEHILFK